MGEKKDSKREPKKGSKTAIAQRLKHIPRSYFPTYGERWSLSQDAFSIAPQVTPPPLHIYHPPSQEPSTFAQSFSVSGAAEISTTTEVSNHASHRESSQGVAKSMAAPPPLSRNRSSTASKSHSKGRSDRYAPYPPRSFTHADVAEGMPSRSSFRSFTPSLSFTDSHSYSVSPYDDPSSSRFASLAPSFGQSSPAMSHTSASAQSSPHSLLLLPYDTSSLSQVSSPSRSLNQANLAASHASSPSSPAPQSTSWERAGFSSDGVFSEEGLLTSLPLMLSNVRRAPVVASPMHPTAARPVDRLPQTTHTSHSASYLPVHHLPEDRSPRLTSAWNESSQDEALRFKTRFQKFERPCDPSALISPGFSTGSQYPSSALEPDISADLFGLFNQT